MSGAGEIEGESGDGGVGVAAGAVLGGWGADCLEAAITFSTSLCIMVESWTKPFAYLVIRRKLYYVITSHMSTQMKVHRWQKNCKDPASKNTQELASTANTARSSHCHHTASPIQ